MICRVGSSLCRCLLRKKEKVEEEEDMHRVMIEVEMMEVVSRSVMLGVLIIFIMYLLVSRSMCVRNNNNNSLTRRRRRS